MKEITFTFKADGSVVVDAAGFRGKGCVETADKIMAAVAGKPTGRKLKQPDFYAQEEVSTNTSCQS